MPPSTHGIHWVLLRLAGSPIGIVRTPDGGCEPAELARLAVKQHGWAITKRMAAADIHAETPRCGRPMVTVAVCTRNRAEQLAGCLQALDALDYPAELLDILVVDNAPADDSTRRLVERYPRMRYACEPAGGLDRARNRAAREARGEIVAYTDDDVIVDPGWVTALARALAEEPHAMCVTGLVVPDELDTPAQVLFEQYGGFGRGFDRQVYRVPPGRSAARLYGGTGRFGTGANMAFRRQFFDTAGLFDPALDVGTPANGGGDLEMFFRVLKAGHALVYEPSAIVRHRHRRDYAELKTQITNNGIGFYAYLVRTARAYPDERRAVIGLGVWWLWWWSVRRLLRAIVRPRAFPIDLIAAELKGSFVGLRRYREVSA